MAWSTPRTWVATELVTAAILNTHIKANQDASVVAVKVRNSADIALSSAAWTGLTFDTEDYDIDNMHSTVSNSSRLTINTPGLYEFGLNSLVSSNATIPVIDGRILVNNSTAVAYGKLPFFPNGLIQPLISFQGLHTLSTAEYLTAQLQPLDSTSNVKASAVWSPVFWAKWLSAT